MSRTGFIQHGKERIPFTVIHRPRVTRRIHLEIDEAGGLQVVAPPRTSLASIRRQLQPRAQRVARFLVEARRRLLDCPPLRYRSGERHLFRGRRYPLRLNIGPGTRAATTLEETAIHIRRSDDDAEGIRRQLAAWYRREAAALFRERLDQCLAAAPWARNQSPELRLRWMKRSWGNCSVRRVITLNPHLVKAPGDILDYVVAHEVCHLREHNHGPAFYALLDGLFPSWRVKRRHLREKGHLYLHQ